jgi:DNA-binding SARP family transcriptional activator
MPALRIQLFGTVQVSHDGLPQDARLIHAVQSLLAWLLLHRRKTHARETLAGLFWGEQSQARARSCLSTALWRLRRVLEPGGIERGTYLIARPDVVGFNCASDYWLDVAAFDDGVGRHLPASVNGDRSLDWSRAEDAVACYTGDLLEGFYDDWALRERERLRVLYLDSLGTLLRRHSETGKLEPALRCGRQILALDPLREDIHREVIRLHVRNGHRALALKQYECCRVALEEELGVEPMEETRALCAELLSAASKSEPSAKPGAIGGTAVTARETRLPPPAKARITPTLRTAAAKLDEARDAIADALRIAESDQSVAGEKIFRR